jgi:hypothetical protein
MKSIKINLNVKQFFKKDQKRFKTAPRQARTETYVNIYRMKKTPKNGRINLINFKL